MKVWTKQLIRDIANGYWQGADAPRCGCGHAISVIELDRPDGWQGMFPPLEIRCHGCGMFAVWSGPDNH